MNEDLYGEYVQELTTYQSQLRAYIFAALGNHANTADVLQRTNLTLWKKAKDFRQGAPFLPWAIGVARYEVLSFLRDRQRDKLVFSEDVAEMLLDSAQKELSGPEDRHLALRECIQNLPSNSRDLLWQRYDESKSIRQIADETGRTEDSIKCFFLRLRKGLERCIRTKMRLGSV